LTGVRIRDVDDESDERDSQLNEAERLRLVYDIITNPPAEGGADIKPGSDKFELVESLLPLHDRVYNDVSRMTRQSNETCKIMMSDHAPFSSTELDQKLVNKMDH
jgi:hypothetical protein